MSAAGQYLRAAEYYRQAFFWHRDDLDGKELTTAYAASVKAFRAALPHLDPPGTVLEGDTPGYFFAPPGGGPFPTILHIGGYDGTAEEQYCDARPGPRARAGRSPVSTARGRARVLYDRRGHACGPTGRTSCPACSTCVAHAPGGRPGEGRARRTVVRRRDRTPGRVRRTAAGGDGRRPRSVRHRRGAGGAVRRRPLEDGRRPGRRSAVERAARRPGVEDPVRTADGDPRSRQPACLGGRHAPLQLPRPGAEDHVPELRDRQRDRRGVHGPGPAAVRRPHLPEGVPPLPPEARAPRATARAWRRSCSGPRRSTGSSRHSGSQGRARRAASVPRRRGGRAARRPSRRCSSR